MNEPLELTNSELIPALAKLCSEGKRATNIKVTQGGYVVSGIIPIRPEQPQLLPSTLTANDLQ